MPVDVSQYLTISAFARHPALLAAYQAYLEAALELPEARIGLSDGLPVVFVGGKLLSRLRIKTDCALALRYDIAARDELIASDPEAFFVTDAQRAYPIVLVRLEKLTREKLWAVVRKALDARPSKKGCRISD